MYGSLTGESADKHKRFWGTRVPYVQTNDPDFKDYRSGLRPWVSCRLAASAVHNSFRVA